MKGGSSSVCCVDLFGQLYWHSLMQTLMDFFSDLNSELIVVVVNLLVMVRLLLLLFNFFASLVLYSVVSGSRF